MKIAIVHYHLKPGGVTNVIKHQVDAISDDCDVLLLTGELPEKPIHENTRLISGLRYTTTSLNAPNPQKIAGDIFETIQSVFGGKADVLHVHNPTLAKNKYFLKILKAIQQKGCNLFLQIHDFAENGRPEAYYDVEPYTANCHYGVINSHDYKLLLQSGLKSEGLHFLPNAVVPIPLSSGMKLNKSRVLYPVRAIRRKNIGEAILISLYLDNKTLSITLPPNSDVDIKSYNNWKDFTKANNLSVEFEAGLHHDFETLIASSEFFISTSITEGFGFSFLEPWTVNKLFWGRKLKTVCSDFIQNGIYLDHLYKRLNVPVSWIGKLKLVNTYMTSIRKNSIRFNRPVNDNILKDFLLEKFNSPVIDFGLLNESFQKKVILKVLSGNKHKEVLQQINPYLSRPGKMSNEKDIVSSNRKAVLQKYNSTTYKTNLLNIYNKVINNPVIHCIDKEIITSHFLDPDNFSLLQWSDYVD